MYSGAEETARESCGFGPVPLGSRDLLPRSAMPQIVLDKVSKSYGPYQALKDVTIVFADLQTTAIVGPSGSGKSTLVQLINGLVPPSAGSVFVFGQPIDYRR